MRFVKLVVKSFQAIESAEIELGRGLNVLYGPNDLGKSTVASALRAALLVMPGTAESSRYRPWFADGGAPEVTLTLVDDDDRYWRVKKSFGASGAQAKADLATSKDGVAFVHDSDGRAVDEQLRKLLGWGIPSPGGKGAPRGLPTSFLANVLLGEQSNVESILAQSTEGDGASSGKERLRKALAGLAEDPWFKRVLTEAQKKVDAYFTPAGQRKRGKGSPFIQASDLVKARGEKLDELRRGVEESRAVEENVRVLRERSLAAREACDEAARELATLRQAYARAAERTRAEEKLARATAEVEALDQRANEVAEAEREAKRLEGVVASAAERVVEASALAVSAEEAVRAAEEALRSAAGEDGARQREVNRANLQRERAELATKKVEAEKLRDAAAAAQKLAQSAKVAGDGKTQAFEDLAKAQSGEEGARVVLTEAEGDLALARSIVAYGQWHAAEAAANQALAARDRAESERARSKAKEAAASECEARAISLEAEATAARALLPDPALTKRIEDLFQRIAMAEASLGGGFSIVLKGTGKAALHVSTDGEQVVGGTMLDGKLVLEADKMASVAIADLLDVEIVAGAAEKRHELERLRERWANEALPFLKRAGVEAPLALREKKTALDALDAKLVQLRSDVRQHRTEAAAAEAAATLEDQRRAMLDASAREASVLEAKLGAQDRALLAQYVERLGPQWKEQADALVSAKEESLAAARSKLENAVRARELAQFRAVEAEKLDTSARAGAEGALAALGQRKGKSPAGALVKLLDEARAELDTVAARVLAVDTELGALEREASEKVNAAKANVERAEASRDAAMAARAGLVQIHEGARADLQRALGRAEALRKALDGADRAGAEQRLVEAKEAFAVYASDPLLSRPGAPALTADDIAAAEAREADAKSKLDECKAEASHAEGALTKVGGAGVRDELLRSREAYDLAKERQHDLEVDADAWRLLRETLEEVEKEGSTHLGKSLAAPVSSRLADLSRGRYSGLRLDQHLRAEAMDVAAAKASDDVLDALSVGTRDQVATLLRLTVAEQLKSAIVLDDHLVHTDPERLEWFRDTLRSVALGTQVIVITCRPHDYLGAFDLSQGATRDLAGGMMRVIDATKVIRRFGPAPTSRR